MDTTRWKSILVRRPVYEEIRQIAHREGRTISGQMTLIFEAWKAGDVGSREIVSNQQDVLEEVNSTLLDILQSGINVARDKDKQQRL